MLIVTQILQANESMNLAELFKFGSDWMDDLITRDELAWAFHIVNAIKATSDEMTGELNFAEFLQTLVYIGMIAFWDSLEVCASLYFLLHCIVTLSNRKSSIRTNGQQLKAPRAARPKCDPSAACVAWTVFFSTCTWGSTRT